MKKAKEKSDELRPEYDLKKLRVRSVGRDRKGFGASVFDQHPEVTVVLYDADPNRQDNRGTHPGRE